MFASNCLSTALEEIEIFAKQIEVAPNPTTGMVKIQWNQAEIQIENYSVRDVTGKEVSGIQPFSAEINLSRLTNGIYFLQLFSNKGVITKKIVLDH